MCLLEKAGVISLRRHKKMRVAKTAHETEENKMKRISKTIALTLSLMLLVMNFTACSAGGKAGKLIKAYTGGSSYYIEEIGWYGSEVYTLKVNDNDTYELIYQKHMFGTTDPGIKGLRTVIYTGKCTSAEAADGWETHRDYTLQPAEHIYFEQHEKGFGRSTIAGHCVIDTDNWTDEMTQVVDPENAAMDAKAFLEAYAETLTITVEDPALDTEDVTLGCRIVDLPELKLLTYAQ